MMLNHSNSKHKQSSLNLNQLEFLLAEGLFTKQAREIVQTMTNEEVLTKDILKQAGKGRFKVHYSYGVLGLVPSQKGKSGRY